MKEIKVSTLMTRVIKIAKRHNDKGLLHWAQLESFGYDMSNKYMTDDDVVPVYREIPIEHRDQYNRPIIVTDLDINNIRVRLSIIELEENSIKSSLLSVKDPKILKVFHEQLQTPATHYILTPSSLKSVLHSIKQEALDRTEKYIDSDSILSETFLFHSKKKIDTQKNSIFLSYSFSSQEKELVDGFKELLELSDFNVLTGEKNPIGSISKSIMHKIQKAEKFVVIMTKRDKKENGKFTTSSWLLEEKGVAIAYKKPSIIFVEKDIDENDIGGIQGDDQRLYFTRNNFATKVADAIRMLKGKVQ